MENRPDIKATIIAVILPAAVVLLVLFVLVMPKVRDNRQANRDAGVADGPSSETVDSFETCVSAGNPVMESYPRQCAAGGQVFTEDLGADGGAPMVGADRDEHGCIGSAGYMWCAPKEKCLRIWEEPCYADLTEEVAYFLADKYGRPVDEVHVTITREESDYASGGVSFGEGGPGEGGVWLARRQGNMWEVVFDGNGSVDCVLLGDEYGFPDTILRPNFCD